MKNKKTVRELLELSNGIIILINHWITENGYEPTDDEIFSVSSVLQFQREINSEIISELSFEELKKKLNE